MLFDDDGHDDHRTSPQREGTSCVRVLGGGGGLHRKHTEGRNGPENASLFSPLHPDFTRM